MLAFDANAGQTRRLMRDDEPVRAFRVPGYRTRAGLFWALQCGGWLAFGVVMYVWALSYWTPLDALANKAALVAVGLPLSLAMRAIYRRWERTGRPRLATGAIAIAVSFAAAAVWIELQALSFQLYLEFARIHGAFIGPVDISIGTLLFHGFVLLTWSLLYFGINAWEDAEVQRARAEQAETIAQIERMRALQAQLNPHLVFNALNAISTLVDERQNAAAKAMIGQLGTFLRLVLDTFDTPEVPLAREIEFVRCYLEIERVRFGARLQAEIDIGAEALETMIPTLMLQPLVENAVRHGILSRELGGKIRIGAAVRDDALEITISDNGNGAPAGVPARTGIGLSNTANRLRALYGDAAAVRFTGSANGGVTAVRIPLRSVPAGTPAEARR